MSKGPKTIDVTDATHAAQLGTSHHGLNALSKEAGQHGAVMIGGKPTVDAHGERLVFNDAEALRAYQTASSGTVSIGTAEEAASLGKAHRGAGKAATAATKRGATVLANGQYGLTSHTGQQLIFKDAEHLAVYERAVGGGRAGKFFSGAAGKFRTARKAGLIGAGVIAGLAALAAVTYSWRSGQARASRNAIDNSGPDVEPVMPAMQPQQTLMGLAPQPGMLANRELARRGMAPQQGGPVNPEVTAAPVDGDLGATQTR